MPMAIASGPIGFAKLPHVSRRLADETLLFAVDGPMELPIRLNSTGSQLWNSIEHRTDFSDDEAALIEALFEHGLLSPRSGDSVTRSAGTRSALNTSVRPSSPAYSAPADFWQLLRTFDGFAPGEHRPESIEQATESATSGSDVDAFIELVERHGAIGQLAHAIDLGWIDATGDQRHQIQERWAANQLHCLRVERLLVEAARILDDAAIEFRVLKGVAVAHLDYPDPSYREFGDADILVRSCHYARALEVLEEGDHLFGRLELGSNPFATKAATLITPQRLMLDVHCRLALGGLGASEPAVLFEASQVIEVAGHILRAPPRSARLVHASLHHFTSVPVRRGTHRDFHEIRNIDVHDLRRVARLLRCSAVTKVVLSSPDSSRPDLAQLLEPSRLERVLAYRRSGVSYHNNLLWREATGLALTPGIGARITYIRERVFPSAEFRHRNDLSWRNYVRVPVVVWAAALRQVRALLRPKPLKGDQQSGRRTEKS